MIDSGGRLPSAWQEGKPFQHAEIMKKRYKEQKMSDNKKRVPINTTRETRDNPMEALFKHMILGNDAIPKQEKEGQKSFVTSETLPTDIRESEKQTLENFGLKFGEKVQGDPMFQHVELPEGWKKIPTDHSMWSDLVDEKGKVRANIFYKAAFYDRSAHLRLV